ACHPRVILFGGEQSETTVLRLHDELCRFFRRISVMIVEGTALNDSDSGLVCGRKELLGISDARKGQHATAFQRRRYVRVRHETAMEYRKPACAAVVYDSPGVGPGTNHQQSIGPRELRG